MKKNLLLFIFIATKTLHSVPLDHQANMTRATLVSVHTKVFSKDNFFNEPLTAKDLSDWESALHKVQEFVHTHGDKEQLNILGLCLAANQDLLHIIQQTCMQHSLPQKEAFSSKKKSTDSTDVKTCLTNIVPHLKKAELTCQKSKEYTPRDNDLTRELLNHLLVMLITTLEKLERDIKKITVD